MNSFYDLLNTDFLLTFFLIAIRVNGILFTAPIFGSGVVDARLRLFISIIIAILLKGSIPDISFQNIPVLLLMLLIIKELLIGIATGLLARFIFAGVQFGGQLIGFQMGFGVVNILDPQTNTQVSIIAQFQNILMILIFLAINGHLYIIKAISYSFTNVPLGRFVFKNESYIYLVVRFGTIFLTAVKIVAPILVTLILLHVVMGIMARLVPQMNVLIVGFPVQIAFGLLVLTLSLSYFYRIFEKIFLQYLKDIDTLFKILGG
ncbi:flagellar biosynthetic protein FliR [Deferribacter thermophilus]|uniref:flagellar biosynthetic protein FliR n=1 Tax=Deferribacter thermophilus TaxID=53573 RepID=UPI003C176881